MEEEKQKKKKMLGKWSTTKIIACVIVAIVVVGTVIPYVVMKKQFESLSTKNTTYSSRVDENGNITYVQTLEDGTERTVTAEEMAEDFSSILKQYIDGDDEYYKEKIKYLIEAETITKFPYIDNAGEDTIQGQIKFYRYSNESESNAQYIIDSEGNETLNENYRIKYITPTEFETKLTNYKNSGNAEVFEYFTMDNEGNVIIAYGTKETRTISTNRVGDPSYVGDTDLTVEMVREISGEDSYAGNYEEGFSMVRYTAEKRKIDYLSLVEQYVMPTNLLYSILITNRDIEFVEAIASLAYDNEIAIGIYDNESESITTEPYIYNKLMEVNGTTSLNFSNIQTSTPAIRVSNLARSPYSNIPYTCQFTTTGGQISHGLFYYPHRAADTETSAEYMYIVGTNSDGKITRLGEENLAKEFITTFKRIRNETSTPTVGVILADTWIARWEVEYKQNTTDNSPSTTPETPLEDSYTLSYNTMDEVFGTFDTTMKDDITTKLTDHADDLEAEAIKNIVDSTDFTAPAEEITVDDVSIEQRKSILQSHIDSCTNCRAAVNSWWIREHGNNQPLPLSMEEDESYYTIQLSSVDISVAPSLFPTIEHIYSAVTSTYGGLRGTIVETDYLAELQNYIDEENARSAQGKEEERKEKFQEDLEEQITCSQSLSGRKVRVNITFTSTYSKTISNYTKNSTQMENSAEKFSEIFNSVDFHEAKQGILAREGWFWEYIRENEDTAKLEDVLRYLLNIATNSNDFGTFTEEDIENLFKAFEPKKIEEDLTGVGLSIGKYLAQFGGDATQYQFDGVSYYKMYNDTAGNPTIGIGDIQWLSNHGRFNLTGTVRYGGEGGTTYIDCNVEQKVNELLGPDGYKTKWEKTYTPAASETIFIDVETVNLVTDKMQSVYYDLVAEQTAELNLSKQQLYALTFIKYATGNISIICGGEDYSVTKTFVDIYKEALSKGYEENSWEFNRYIWENWWCIKWAGGYSAGRYYSGWLKSRDATFETYVKGTFSFGGKAGATREQNGYMFYSAENISMIGFSSSSATARYARNRDTSDLAAEQELFTYVEVASMYPEGIRTFVTAGHEYPEYPQSAKVGSQYVLYKDRRYGIFYPEKTLGTSGCGTYSMACIASGLLGDPSIDPVAYVDNLDEYYPDGSYYVYGTGSNSKIRANDFLEKYYGLHSQSCSSESEMLRIFEERNGNCAATGAEEGHIFAILPIIGDPDGYKFYVIDSARGHTGKYKSGSDFLNSTTATKFEVNSIIYP